jgi:hypothetical protein
MAKAKERGLAELPARALSSRGFQSAGNLPGTARAKSAATWPSSATAAGAAPAATASAVHQAERRVGHGFFFPWPPSPKTSSSCFVLSFFISSSKPDCWIILLNCVR